MTQSLKAVRPAFIPCRFPRRAGRLDGPLILVLDSRESENEDQVAARRTKMKTENEDEAAAC